MTKKEMKIIKDFEATLWRELETASKNYSDYDIEVIAVKRARWKTLIQLMELLDTEFTDEEKEEILSLDF